MDMQVAALDILITKGHFSPEAARAIGEAMDLQIARSYEDLATNKRLDETRVLLKSDITAVEVRLDSKIDSLRMELKADIAALEAKLIRWMFAALAGQGALVVGLVRLLTPHGGP
jgi:hypothetical protein